MRALLLSTLLFCGCAITPFAQQKENLKEEIELLELDVRKQILQHRYDHLISGKCGTYCGEVPDEDE
jgi:hypothetical protein